MAGKRGRPVASQIRQNIVEILNVMGKGYGYDIFKVYIEVFPKATMRSIYYHLRKGLETKEIQIEKVERVKGDYSWGPEAEKIFYKLGPAAQAKGDMRVKKFIDKRGMSHGNR